MNLLRMLAAALLAAAAPCGAAFAQSAEATRFGAREQILDIALSPDGTRVVVVAPFRTRGSSAFIAPIGGGAATRILTATEGNERIATCDWVSNARLICRVAFINNTSGLGLETISRLILVNTDGTNPRVIQTSNARSLYFSRFGGAVIDWQAGGSSGDAVLIMREFVPEEETGSRVTSRMEGIGVERIDGATLRRQMVEPGRRDASEYISDGRGVVRIMGMAEFRGDVLTGVTRYFYRKPGERNWQPLSSHDANTQTGFNPYAVDPDLNVAYGIDKHEGRLAVFKVALDGSNTRTLVHARSDVDVDGLVRVGRQRRVVGAAWTTDRAQARIFDPPLEKLINDLSRAIPNLPLIQFIDANADESRLLLWAGADVDPGRYYVFDRNTRQLAEIGLTRPELEQVRLAPVRAVTYRAADGTQVPAYLTLPPGSDGKGLPAIVMPHGGPSARDEWGFDWFAQFFAARGYAVLQPNYRGSSGYGDAWYQRNGFQSWRTAIGDVNDAGRWLVAQGIAAPDKLGIVGWSYGGYAALQSAVVDPALFKAIVAIAPVTDLATLRDRSIGTTSARIERNFIGTGPHIREGSPAQNVDRITAPVLLYHGTLDLNVDVSQSRMMADRLRAAGKRVDYVQVDGLEHQLADSAVRAQMLDRADTFLRSTLGIAAR